jgi:hypothetical protein
VLIKGNGGSNNGGKYCGFDSDDKKMKCTFGQPSYRTHFTVVGTNGLKFGNRYCSLWHDGTEIQCRKEDTVQRWPFGYFNFNRIRKGDFSFQGKVGNVWKTCCDEGNNGVKCNRGKVGSWETFQISKIV